MFSLLTLRNRTRCGSFPATPTASHYTPPLRSAAFFGKRETPYRNPHKNNVQKKTGQGIEQMKVRGKKAAVSKFEVSHVFRKCYTCLEWHTVRSVSQDSELLSQEFGVCHKSSKCVTRVRSVSQISECHTFRSVTRSEVCHIRSVPHSEVSHIRSATYSKCHTFDPISHFDINRFLDREWTRDVD